MNEIVKYDDILFKLGRATVLPSPAIIHESVSCKKPEIFAKLE